jgi:hypothetical protein
MVLGLKRYQDKGHLHFVTFCCYRRVAHLEMTRREIFSRMHWNVCVNDMTFRLSATS